MTKLGILVGERGNWAFFKEIYQDLSGHFQTEIFEEKNVSAPIFQARLNRWAFQRRLAALLARNEVCFFEWASELLVPASKLPKTSRLVTRLHSFELFVWAPRVNWDHVDRVILVSRHMQDKFSSLYPDHAQKTDVVYNGVRLDKFRPPERRDFSLSLGMLGNIHPVKRIYEAVLMLHTLNGHGCRPHLHIAGDRWEGGYFDDYYTAVHRLIQKLGLADQVTLHGYVDQPERWLQGMDIILSNSYWEGQQVALLEAMACGCHCLAHFWDGAEEILPAGNLYATEGELIEKILAFAGASAAERVSSHQAMRAIAEEKFDIANTAAGVRDLIQLTAATPNLG